MAATHHLAGYGQFEDVVSHVRVGGFIEYYVDDNKAIFRVTSFLDSSQWEESVYRRPAAMSIIRNQISLLREMSGVEDLGHERIPDTTLDLCLACGGVGFNEDQDGNQIDCPECEGQGGTGI